MEVGGRKDFPLECKICYGKVKFLEAIKLSENPIDKMETEDEVKNLAKRSRNSEKVDRTNLDEEAIDPANPNDSLITEEMIRMALSNLRRDIEDRTIPEEKTGPPPFGMYN